MNIPRIGTGPIPTADGLTAFAGSFFKRLKHLFNPQLALDGADWLNAQQTTIDDLYKRLAKSERHHVAALTKTKADAMREAKSFYQRTVTAIEEMTMTKGRSASREQPVAVIISPYQYAQLSSHGFNRIKKLQNVSLHVAKGVYGPVVLTQDAFNGLSRMAPELNIRTMDKASESDW